jgi:hypothetical protein
MSTPTTSESLVGGPARQRIATAMVFCLWLAYAVLQTLAVMQRLSEPAYAAIGFLPGILGVGVLLAAGISRGESADSTVLGEGVWGAGRGFRLCRGTPVPIVVAIVLVPFLSGIGWGWQVKRDGTIVWAMIQHSLIWVVGSPFAFGP